MGKHRKLKIKTPAKRTDSPSGTRSASRPSRGTSGTPQNVPWSTVWAAFLEAVASGQTTEEAIEAHPEWQIASASTLHRRIAADEQMWAEYMQARKAALIGVSESILPIVDDGRNDWMEKESGRGNTYTVPNHENVQRSRLRADARFKLLESLMHEVFGKRIDLSNRDGSFAAMWATALEETNKPGKKDLKK